MGWKPSENEIADYLAGELSPVLAEKFAVYLQNNPEFAREMAELKQTRNMLATIADEEVIPPVSLFSGKKESETRKTNRSWVYPVSIAASVTLVLLAGYFTNFSLAVGKDGVKMSFRNTPVVPPTETLSLEVMQEIVDTRLRNERQYWQQELQATENKLTGQLNEYNRLNRRELARLAAQPSVIEQKYLEDFAARLTAENRQQMQAFFTGSARQQQEYMRNVLFEFQAYLYEQRQQDLQVIAASLLDIKLENEEKQQLTNKILADIITTVNTQNSPGR